MAFGSKGGRFNSRLQMPTSSEIAGFIPGLTSPASSTVPVESLPCITYCEWLQVLRDEDGLADPSEAGRK
jgi:hypothetical protein